MVGWMNAHICTSLLYVACLNGSIIERLEVNLNLDIDKICVLKLYLKYMINRYGRNS